MMFSLVTKIIKRATQYPIAILVFSLILALLSIYPVENLRWELQLQDALTSKGSSPLYYHEIEEKFGALGSLTVVLQSPDSALNYSAAQKLYQKLSKDTSIHFVEFETDIEFYKKHSLLYIEETDLDTIESRIRKLQEKITLDHNPLYVDVSGEITDSAESNKDKGFQPTIDFTDLENKYFTILSKTHASSDGTVRVVDIYPKNSLSDLRANRILHGKVKNFFKDNPDYASIKVYYTGKVYDTIQTGRTLLPEAKFAGKITALFILLLFIIHFYKQPQLILVSAIPVGLPILYTLALAWLLYGRINVFTLLLALVLPGQACQIITHILNRYFIERTRNLNPKLCIESAVLGIGPSTAVSAGIMASIFICLIIVPVAGIRELGVLGAIGSLLNWSFTLLISTSLLQLFQRKKAFTVNSFRFQRVFKITLLSYRTNGIIITILSILSLGALIYGGVNLKFLYDFRQTELPREERIADSLIAQTGFPQYDPVIVMMSKDNSDELYKRFKELKSSGKIPRIESLYTLSAFSPKNQIHKKEKLKKIQDFFTNDVLQQLDSTERLNVSKISEILYRFNFDEDEQPENIRKKFSDINGNAGAFAFIFSNINPENGLECRRLARDLSLLNSADESSYKMTGVPVFRAKFLDLVLSNVDKTIFLGSVLVWFFLLFFYNRFSRAIFTILPSVFAMSWLLALINVLGIKLSVYSTIAFPILIGASVDGSIQLWTAYYEKRKGTALTLLQGKAFSISISQMASMIGTYGLLMSSHPGLKSIGQISFIGLICISIAQFALFSLIAGSLDNYRILQRQKKENAQKSLE
ncbi:MAG: RND transporter [Fibrobacter sp.]|nr:RND transporter [Fibrobacter sp.]